MSSGRWAGSNRKSRLPSNWAAICAQVMRRDLYRCRWRLPSGELCRERATDVDHIEPGDDHSLGNLQALCGRHHDLKSAYEGVEARRRKREKAMLPPDQTMMRQSPTALPWEV